MKKIGFIGACDKTNLIMYVAKALEWQGKKVLVVDASLVQRMKYTIPTINPESSYLSDFEGIDFAIGFFGKRKLEKHFETDIDRLPYDYMLVDIDTKEALANFEIGDFDKNYFVTTFELYSLRKGLEIIKEIREPLQMTKVLYRYTPEKEDDEYINYLSMDYRVEWDENSIYLPNDGSDIQEIEENQKISKINRKR